MCPGQGDPFDKAPPQELPNRDLLEPIGFEMFVQNWIRKACESAVREEWFEAFIYYWVTFNAWVAQVVADRDYSEKDWYLFQAAGLDPILTRMYDQLLEKEIAFRRTVHEFHSLWPVFKVRTLIENGFESWGAWGSGESRLEYRQ
jgi:hypothetical protein